MGGPLVHSNILALPRFIPVNPEKKTAQKQVDKNYKVGPLPAINGVITPISRVITPVTNL